MGVHITREPPPSENMFSCPSTLELSDLYCFGLRTVFTWNKKYSGKRWREPGALCVYSAQVKFSLGSLFGRPCPGATNWWGGKSSRAVKLSWFNTKVNTWSSSDTSSYYKTYITFNPPPPFQRIITGTLIPVLWIWWPWRAICCPGKHKQTEKVCVQMC